MDQANAFPKIFALGHRAVADILEGPVEITEKIDGSQFGFGKLNGQLVVRSKGRIINLDYPDAMFKQGIEYVRSIEDCLPDGMFFYGEYLRVPKHNTLAYARIPKNHIMLFGVKDVDGTMLRYSDIQYYADKFEVEPVPAIIHNGIVTAEDIFKLLDRESALGGAMIEGVVVKDYSKGIDMHGVIFPIRAAKYVSEAFKEKHGSNPSFKPKKDLLISLVEHYTTEARWEKAIQHLRDNGELLGEPKDIGNLIKEVQKDVLEECLEEIKDALWEMNRKSFTGGIVRGFPEWYKEKLAKGEVQIGN